MTTETHELPEIGELVVATIAKVGDHGAYATLDEYSNVQGFLHVSEIGQGWIRNINKFIKNAGQNGSQSSQINLLEDTDF